MFPELHARFLNSASCIAWSQPKSLPLISEEVFGDKRYAAGKRRLLSVTHEFLENQHPDECLDAAGTRLILLSCDISPEEDSTIRTCDSLGVRFGRRCDVR